MDGPLHFPVADAAGAGRGHPDRARRVVAAHAAAVRARPHQSVADRRRAGLDDRRYAALPCPRRARPWQRIFAEHLGGRPIRRVIVTHFHPDHIGLAGWLTERWQAPLVDHREGMAARAHDDRDGGEDSPRAAPRFRPPRRARRRGQRRSSPSARATTAAACRRCRRPITASARAASIEIGGRAVAGHRSARATRRSIACLLLRRDRRPDRRRPDPAADFAQYQRAGRTSRTATRSPAISLADKLRGAAAARHAGTAVAQSAVPRRPSAHRRAGGASPTSAAPRCSPPATAR